MMKKNSVIALIVSAMLCFSFYDENNAAIQVRITGIESNKGQLALLLFKGGDGFPSDNTKAIRQVVIPVVSPATVYTFSDLPMGTYAITVMHDENKNDKLDTNMFGIPEEGIGVSNNALNMFGPPVFNECAFNLNAASAKVDIQLDY
jgi:uncharacterized protein (DUF2141 family)